MNDQATGEILSPSQLNTLARDLLEGAFPLVWVEGELSGVSRPASGHLYFGLKDARAQVRCAMFKPKSTWLKFAPREGVKVLARGRLTLYEARGDYQLVLDHMEEAGEGALRRAYEELKSRLEAEGLFDAARKRPLPAYVRRLAVITSPSGAAVRDVLSVLARRFPLVEAEVLPVLVQGATAAAQITAMLARAARSGRYDAILLARGGGSLEDLWAFNDEALARAIAASAVPVVSAVGHETDFSLSDFAADLRAPAIRPRPNCWCRTPKTSPGACARWSNACAACSASGCARRCSAPTALRCACRACARRRDWNCWRDASPMRCGACVRRSRGGWNNGSRGCRGWRVRCRRSVRWRRWRAVTRSCSTRTGAWCAASGTSRPATQSTHASPTAP